MHADEDLHCRHRPIAIARCRMAGIVHRSLRPRCCRRVTKLQDQSAAHKTSEVSIAEHAERFTVELRPKRQIYAAYDSTGRLSTTDRLEDARVSTPPGRTDVMLQNATAHTSDLTCRSRHRMHVNHRTYAFVQCEFRAMAERRHLRTSSGHDCRKIGEHGEVWCVKFGRGRRHCPP